LGRDLVVSVSVLQWLLIFPVYPRWLAIQRIDGTSGEMRANTQQPGVSEMLNLSEYFTLQFLSFRDLFSTFIDLETRSS